MASQISRRLFSTTARRMQGDTLQKESKRNPEIMVRAAAHHIYAPLICVLQMLILVMFQILGGVMVAALGGAGYYFGKIENSLTELCQ